MPIRNICFVIGGKLKEIFVPVSLPERFLRETDASYAARIRPILATRAEQLGATEWNDLPRTRASALDRAALSRVMGGRGNGGIQVSTLQDLQPCKRGNGNRNHREEWAQDWDQEREQEPKSRMDKWLP